MRQLKKESGIEMKKHGSNAERVLFTKSKEVNEESYRVRPTFTISNLILIAIPVQ